MNKSLASRLAGLLSRASIPATAVTAAGKFVHIDSFETHGTRLKCLLIDGGFRILKASSGPHLDGFRGYRVSAIVK